MISIELGPTPTNVIVDQKRTFFKSERAERSVVGATNSPLKAFLIQNLGQELGLPPKPALRPAVARALRIRAFFQLRAPLVGMDVFLRFSFTPQNVAA